MILNNTIVSTTPSTLSSWAPQNLFQATLLTAILLTTLSYQATSVIHHLLFGIKPPNQASANQLHNLLLSDEASPLSTISAILRNDAIDAFRHRLPQGTIFTRTFSTITPKTIFVLALLLITAPIINTITIALAVESDKHLTFASSNVLLALGIRNETIDSFPYIKGTCSRLRDDFTGKVTAQFFSCSDSAVNRPLFRNYPDQSRVSITAGVQGDVSIEIFITGANFSSLSNRYIDVSISPRTYRLAHAIDPQSLAALTEIVAKRVEEACDAPDIVTQGRNNTVRQIDNSIVPQVVAEALINCNTVQPDGRVGTGMVVAAFKTVTEMLSLVDVPELLLLDASELQRSVSQAPPWIVGNELPVMTKREPNAPVLWIAIVLGIVLIIRFVIECFTHNDIADGVEAVVVSRLGFRSGYELIRSDDTIRYDRMLRNGEQLHFGIPRSGWLEVNKFDRPVGVLWHDEESFPGDKA